MPIQRSNAVAKMPFVEIILQPTDAVHPRKCKIREPRDKKMGRQFATQRRPRLKSQAIRAIVHELLADRSGFIRCRHIKAAETLVVRRLNITAT